MSGSLPKLKWFCRQAIDRCEGFFPYFLVDKVKLGLRLR